jgi:hypothetical protein
MLVMDEDSDTFRIVDHRQHRRTNVREQMLFRHIVQAQR